MGSREKCPGSCLIFLQVLDLLPSIIFNNHGVEFLFKKIKFHISHGIPRKISEKLKSPGGSKIFYRRTIRRKKKKPNLT